MDKNVLMIGLAVMVVMSLVSTILSGKTWRIPQVVLVVFVFMNTGSVRVDLMFVVIQAPISLIVLMASTAGVLLWPLLRHLLPKKKRT